MLDWFDYHGHMCIAFEMLGLSVFDFLVSIFQACSKSLLNAFSINFVEGQQLPALSTRTSAAHRVSVMLLSQIFARQQIDAHRFEARKYPVCRFRF